MAYSMIGIGTLICAILAIHTKQMLPSAVWLALTSTQIAILLYFLGAPHIAVIELSVGAGLVTVLFVFAINISGEDITRLKSLLPKPLAIVSIMVAGGLGLYLVLQATGIVQLPVKDETTSYILWDQRYLGLLLQVVFIFAGVLGVIGRLADKHQVSQKEDVT